MESFRHIEQQEWDLYFTTKIYWFLVDRPVEGLVRFFPERFRFSATKRKYCLFPQGQHVTGMRIQYDISRVDFQLLHRGIAENHSSLWVQEGHSGCDVTDGVKDYV